MNIQEKYHAALCHAESVAVGEAAQVDDLRSDGFIFWVGDPEGESEGLSVSISNKGLGEDLRYVRVGCDCVPYDDGVTTQDLDEVLDAINDFARVPDWR
jgi:hypothetical protein